MLTVFKSVLVRAVLSVELSVDPAKTGIVQPVLLPESVMFKPVALMAVAFKLFYATVVLLRARVEVLQRERNTAWVHELVSTHE